MSTLPTTPTSMNRSRPGVSPQQRLLALERAKCGATAAVTRLDGLDQATSEQLAARGEIPDELHFL